MLNFKIKNLVGVVLFTLIANLFVIVTTDTAKAGPIWTIYGQYRSQFVTLDNGKMKVLWDRTKNGEGRQYLPIFGPVYDSKRNVLYFLESAPKDAYLHQYNLADGTTKVLWKADRQTVKQVIFYPHSFADSMNYDEETQTIYWAGRTPGRNGPTTFYAFDTKDTSRPPRELTNIQIHPNRQIGQSAVYKGHLYVSSINEGIYKFPLDGKSGGLWITSSELGRGKARGPSIDPSSNKLYFSVGLDVFETNIADKPSAKKLFSIDKDYYLIWGISKLAGNNEIYITAKKAGSGGVMISKNLKHLTDAPKIVPFGRTSSASKNLIVVPNK